MAANDVDPLDHLAHGSPAILRKSPRKSRKKRLASARSCRSEKVLCLAMQLFDRMIVSGPHRVSRTHEVGAPIARGAANPALLAWLLTRGSPDLEVDRCLLASGCALGPTTSGVLSVQPCF